MDSRGRPGLPASIAACLFDLDGVVTKTASVHAKAWALTFDAFLSRRAERTGTEFVPFDQRADYAAYVDGKRRADGVRAFLASRDISLPNGDPDDGPDAETVHGLGNRKNTLLQELISSDGVEVYPSSVTYIQAVRRVGLATAVVSSSANTARILTVTGLTDLFDVRVDGAVAREKSLPGKPAPDTFRYAATELGRTPGEVAVFEDALAGVAAGRGGQFGYVVGVDRLGQREQLFVHGADTVVGDLGELLPGKDSS